MDRQEELFGDAERITEYGQRHAESYTGMRYEGVRLVALFTDPDAHRDAIAALIEHPDRVDLRTAPYSRTTLDAAYAYVRDALERERGAWTSYGPGLAAVPVNLRGGYDTLAADLFARFGDKLSITIGGHTYPLSHAAPRPARRLPESTVSLPHARFDVAPDADEYRIPSVIRGKVRITNVGSGERLRFYTGATLIGCLCDDSGYVVGVYHGEHVLVGALVDLAVGESCELDFVAGMDSVDPAVGTVVPPGTYSLVLVIDMAADRQRFRDERQSFVTPPVRIVLTAAELAGDN